jgi:enediyne biosynthesis protein E3
LGVLFQWLFDISSRETSFERRGFRGGNAGARSRLEQVGVAFTAGYRSALEDASHAALIPRLEATSPDFRGFAYEGAAMALALLDRLTPWNRSRVSKFLTGPGDPHAYMIHVGAGWVLARMPGRVEKFIARFDPLLRWLIVDGYGFHEAFFHWPRYLGGAPLPNRLQGYALRAFDQGFGRCLWFVEGTEVSRIAQTIAGFSPERRGDLWSGVGLAAVYAGEVSEAELESLRDAVGPFVPQVAQGASFAAKARQRAGNLKPYHDLACGVLCSLSAAEAAQVSDEALENLPADGAQPAYEIWRQRIQQRFFQPREVAR